MKQSILFPLVILLLSFTIACNEGEDGDPDEPKGTATFTVSGAETAELTYEEVVFTYVISTVSGGEFSAIDIYIGNIGTTTSAIRVGINEFENSTGFDEITYTYEDMSTPDYVGFIATYVNESTSYLVDPEGVNKITFTSITDSKIKGSFEVNLIENFVESGNKVKITGTFEAVGEAGTL